MRGFFIVYFAKKSGEFQSKSVKRLIPHPFNLGLLGGKYDNFETIFCNLYAKLHSNGKLLIKNRFRS